MTTAFKENQSSRLPENYRAHVESVLERQMREANEAYARQEREAQRQREENEWKQEVFVSALIGVGIMIIIISTWVLTK